MKKVTKIGILGGSFDPVHNGHLQIAEYARTSLDLQTIYFMPANQAPLKMHKPFADNTHRLNMLSLALEKMPFFQILDIELNSQEINYTYNTVLKFLDMWDTVKIYLIIGRDQLMNLHKWHEISELSKLVDFVSVDRPGFQGHLKCHINLHWVREQLIDISSSRIRLAISEGDPIDSWVPEKVANYIKNNELYQ